MIRTALRLLRDASVAGEPLAKAEYSLSHVYYATGRPDDSLDHLRIGQQVSHDYLAATLESVSMGVGNIRTVHQACTECPPWGIGQAGVPHLDAVVCVTVAENTSRRGCSASREILSTPCKRRRTVQETSGAGMDTTAELRVGASPSGVLRRA